MSEVSTVGIDLAKSVFQVHGADTSGAVVFRKKLRRDQVLTFFSTLPRCVVAMEACASAHYWAREIALAGHETRLISPAYVKPFVKRQKNDMAGPTEQRLQILRHAPPEPVHARLRVSPRSGSGENHLWTTRVYHSAARRSLKDLTFL